MVRGLLSKEMGMKMKTTEEEFNVMSCPKLTKVGMQRDETRTFAKYRMFSIEEQRDVVRAADCGTLTIADIPVILSGFKARGMKLELEFTW
eukprot:g18097.t1